MKALKLKDARILAAGALAVSPVAVSLAYAVDMTCYDCTAQYNFQRGSCSSDYGSCVQGALGTYDNCMYQCSVHPHDGCESGCQNAYEYTMSNTCQPDYASCLADASATYFSCTSLYCC